MSYIDLPKNADSKTIQEFVETLIGKKKATIVDLEEPMDIFPSHEALE